VKPFTPDQLLADVREQLSSGTPQAV